MINSVPNGSWIFNIDADEKVIQWDEGTKEFLERTGQRGFRLCVKVAMYGSATTTLRLIKQTHGLRYTTDHREVMDDAGIVDVHMFPILKSIVIDHHPIADHKRMRPFMDQYKDWLFKWERSQPKNQRVN